MPDSKLECRQCRCPLPDSDAVWLTSHNKQAEKPYCRDCYERSIRFVSLEHLHSYSAQRFPGAADAEYHGEGYRG
jgi:hypothetical protein